MKRIRKFFQRASRSIAIVRMYWATEDYDWSTILRVLKFQIERTRAHLESHDNFVGVEGVIADMALAEKLVGEALDEKEGAMESLMKHLSEHLLEWWD